MGREARVQRQQPKVVQQPKVEVVSIWSAEQLRDRLLAKPKKQSGIIDITLPDAAAGRTLTVNEEEQL